MSIQIDDADVRAYIRDLDRVPARLQRDIIAVGEKGAVNIKNDWSKAWAGHSYIGPLSRSINYDRRIRGGTIEWEIGPDKSRAQGALGNIIEYGTVNNAPIPGGLPALGREMPRIDRHTAEATAKALNGR